MKLKYFSDFVSPDLFLPCKIPRACTQLTIKFEEVVLQRRCCQSGSGSTLAVNPSTPLYLIVLGDEMNCLLPRSTTSTRAMLEACPWLVPFAVEILKILSPSKRNLDQKFTFPDHQKKESVFIRLSILTEKNCLIRNLKKRPLKYF